MISRGSGPRFFAVIALAIVVVAAPTADLGYFGFHDHFADADDGGHVGALGGLHHVSHHCDLGMNPGGVLTSSALTTVLLATAEPRDLAPCSIVLRPFVPFTPPRA